MTVIKPLPLATQNELPQYILISQKIKTYIAKNQIEASEALPSERDLCALMGTSRVTLRRALDVLVQENIVQRKHGAGTFVLPKRAHLGSSLKGFTGNAHKHGQNPQAIWIMKAYGTPTLEEAQILKIPLSAQVVRLGRVRLSDAEPLAIEQAVVPAKLLPDITQISQSLYEALDRLGNRPVKGTQRVRASRANPTEAGLLSIQENSEVLRIERQTQLADGTPVELTRSTYRGDKYDIVMNLEHNFLKPVG
ncbi:MAG TPA: GntR family transcriptional regulator [Hellea balneolensis]|uniref:GntR family transcriptional regulator n=1 Tax=Hellea balneolensis TaxID=287478 RepID=A0A7C5M234_9PROT|nr:GntR family transcriptional regulator [Hellea balneolensis]